MKRSYSKLALLAAATVLATGALAQATAPGAMPGASAPAAVGTTPQTAAQADKKAIQRSDTGTVVRTAPSVADRARQATATTPAATTTTTTNGAAPMVSGTAGNDGTPRSRGMRPARADRN